MRLRSSQVWRFATVDRASRWRPFGEAKDSTARNKGWKQQQSNTDSIGVTAKKMARSRVDDEARWVSLIEEAKVNIASLTPMDIALLVNALTRVLRADSGLYEMLRDRITHMMAFFSTQHLAMIISAYVKAGLMEQSLYDSLKAEINQRMYELSTPTEICMILNAVARYKDRDEQFLVKLAAHTTHHITEFLTEEIALLASRYHALDIYDKALFDAIEERVTRHVGRFLTNDAIATLAAFSHFDAENERIRELLKKHIKEQREYLDAEDYAERIRSANLSPEDRADLLNSEA
ncbi:hypothetical protein BBBOND_0106480 [Babesia bigemina]|uniref:RNA-editing substrate-binding complex 6 protein domain-containing protein n=1 Tax=Babesia bigemina TaxID=5866 RepID=A0A061D602_BABBI|nr:hypothetical protein BBBOND_0106480 [Babesia bigemina]CDR94339.1 hypothetical protein BBBOND_0106480 [Babesia bigemina]|eukprot:XP_012766525.1 hypothetical protein BBBOND_0106480 [Babesia bigemina]